ncbi:Monooxygenase FAD-binding protein [Botryosphaeria dothidea]|uniref:Monooxygenase FAD-binding protein n=1 Tax=Botryosphaeria dothidea TaxID=55169 RepID=A0A8H4N6D6_9PEZI|nr:Monooxygenase FAD-binding protein [Botryosphaeria dothidea]
MGIEDEVYRHAAPPHIAGRTAWYTGFGVSEREIFSRDAWGGGKYAEEYAGFSASKYCVLPQIRLEPMLKRRATGLNPDGIFFNTEVLAIQDGKSASVKVRFRDSNKEAVYAA